MIILVNITYQNRKIYLGHTVLTSIPRVVYKSQLLVVWDYGFGLRFSLGFWAIMSGLYLVEVEGLITIKSHFH